MTIMRLVWIIIFKKPEAANQALFWIIKVETEGVLGSQQTKSSQSIMTHTRNLTSKLL